jgi:glutamate--cysteine ligase regulatory subunit
LQNCAIDHVILIFFFPLIVDILPKETLNKIMKAQSLVGDNATLHPRWVLKYTVFVKCRGVVADKG